MAIQLGYEADAYICSNIGIDPMEEKTFIGRMSTSGLPMEPRHPHRRMIAVAGMVAEVLWGSGHDEDYADPWGWEGHLLVSDNISDSDWLMAGCEPGDPDDDLLDVAAEVARFFMGDVWSRRVGFSRTLMSDTDAIHTFRMLPDTALAA